MPRAYAIGDVHGQFEKLTHVHQLIAQDRKQTGDHDAPVVHLGDLVDRGPESAEVIEYLAAGPTGPAPWITVKGNHDRLYELFVRDGLLSDGQMRAKYTWLSEPIGGVPTLESYGLQAVAERRASEVWDEAKAKVPAHHVAFVETLPYSYQIGEWYFVHAGIRPGIPLAQQSAIDQIWIRKEFHEDHRDHGALIVHGHTPIDQVTHYGNRVNVDTGAAYGKTLSAVVFEDEGAFLLTDAGRQPLHAPVDFAPQSAL